MCDGQTRSNKRTRPATEFERATKRQCLAALNEEHGWLGNRGCKTGVCQWTVHPKRDREEDTKENWDQLRSDIGNRLDEALRKDIINGYVIQLEYWEEDQVPFRLLERQNFHIHILVTSTYKWNKMQWHRVYKRVLEGFADQPEDYKLTAVSQYHPDESVALAYWCYYLCKQDDVETPVSNNIDLAYWCEKHADLNDFYKVNLAKHIPPGFSMDVMCGHNNIRRNGAVSLRNLFEDENLFYSTITKKITFRSDDTRMTLDEWFEWLGNHEHYKMYIDFYEVWDNLIRKKAKLVLPFNRYV